MPLRRVNKNSEAGGSGLPQEGQDGQRDGVLGGEVGALLQAMQGFLQVQQQLMSQQVNAARVAHREGPSSLDHFLRLAPPPFKGESRLDIADFWIAEVEKKFRVMNCEEEDKVRLATYL